MCGIGGVLAFDGRPDTEIAERMVSCMGHRGPDDQGIHVDGKMLLAHRRLSVLDPSRAGRQPMSNADGSAWIVYNGEVYNYRELRERVSDYPFQSDTDTEVLLALYDEYGVDFLEHLRGMFAFAIWDEKADRLVLARDRLGQKPLFYHHDDEAFRFGSTIGSILSDDAVVPAPDHDAIRSYLTYQYVPHPSTGFEGIETFAPGEYMIVDENGLRTDQYWAVSHGDQFTASVSELTARLREEFREAVRLRMRSDVPLGVFLSGGIDSSIVTAVMADLADTSIETYSIGFGEYDELDFAREVAEAHQTNHHEYTVTPDAMEVLPDLVDHYEMPFGDPSALPTYYLSKVASDDITVALAGDAGDENFAGYDRYTWDKVTNWVATIPRPLRQMGSASLRTVPNVFSRDSSIRRVQRLLQVANGDATERYAAYICHMLGDDASSVWDGTEPADELADLRRAFSMADGSTRLDRVMAVDFRTYLPDDLLVKVDRASMAHSLEVRSPFLDHRFIEFASRIPSRLKWKRGKKKWLLKRAFEDVVPDAVLHRSKQGFSVPVDAWFRGELRSFAREKLERLGNRPVFDANGLLAKLDRHVEGDADQGHHLWNLILLEAWYERFID